MEEVRHELGGQSADLLAAKTPFELGEGTSRQIDRNLRLGLVHWQQETVACNADLCFERPPQGLAHCKCAILNRMMLVNLQVAVARQLERKSAMLGQLFEHVIEEADAGGNLDRRGCIQTHADADVGFLRPALDGCVPSGQGAHDGRPGFRVAAVSQYAQSAHAEIAGEFQVSFAIADDRAGGEVNIRIPQIVLYEPDLGFAAVAAVGGKVRADEYRVKGDAL